MTDETPRLEAVTHDGSFHADDVLCFHLLKEGAVGYDVDLVRTRDPAFTVPKDGRLIFDVGGLHDPGRYAFDHHQVDRTLRPDGVPYSAFGLLWKHLGLEYLEERDLDLPEETLAKLWKEIDEGFVREIDIYDNGLEKAPVGHLSSMTEDLVPSRGSKRHMDREFEEAAQTVGYLFQRHVFKLASAWRDVERFRVVADLESVPGVAILREALDWKRAVHELGLDDLLYVVFPKDDPEGEWYCAAVQSAPGSFDLRTPLPATWAGTRDDDLALLADVPDAVFCHAGRFLCGARSREGAVDLARNAILGTVVRT